MTYSEQQKVSSVSSKTPTNGEAANTDTTGYTNIWSQILKEVKLSTKNSPPPKSIIVLGDNESGRSTLISRLKGVENVSKGIGLEYHYIDVKDEDRDEILKLNVWIPDGDGACTNLLKFALNESNFEHTMIAFVVSMSTPWTIMESLQKWAGILRDHIKKLNLPEAKRDEFMKTQYRAFQMYQDPDENLATTTSGPSTSGKKTGPVKPITAPTETDDSVLLPLDPFILSKNIGLPIAVIVTKSDYVSILDKELDYRIEHFDFIQFHIRRFCLEYGAALFYTTVKDKRTFDNLYRYLTHKLYQFSFNIPASVVDREAIFIPSGWDNESKINILMENSATLKSDSDYAEIIQKPSIRKSLPGRELETILAIDDQEFLGKLQIILNKSSAPASKSEDMSTTTPINMTTTTPTVLKTPHKPPVHKGTNPNGTDSTNLKNFFQNLLNKNAPSSSSAASGATMSPPPSDGSRLEKSPSGNNLSSPSQQPPNNPASPE